LEDSQKGKKQKKIRENNWLSTFWKSEILKSEKKGKEKGKEKKGTLK